MYKISDVPQDRLRSYLKRLQLNCPSMAEILPFYESVGKREPYSTDWASRAMQALIVVIEIEDVLDRQRENIQERDDYYAAVAVYARRQWKEYSAWCLDRQESIDRIVRSTKQASLFDQEIPHPLIGGIDVA